MRVVLGVIALIVITQIILVVLLMQQPWTGIKTKALARQAEVLQVVAIAEGSPGEALLPFSEQLSATGQRITQLPQLRELEFHNETIPLNWRVRTEPLAIPTYAAFTDYLQLQHRLHQALTSQEPLTFVLANNYRVTLTPLPHTPLRAIPMVFWGLFIVNVSGLLVGTFVWICKPRQLEAFVLFIAGLSYFFLESVFSLLIVREFYLPADWMRTATLLQVSFLYIFVLALFTLIAYYPKQLLPYSYLKYMLGLAVVATLNFHFQWLQIPIHTFVLPFIPIYLIGVWFAYLQWVKSKNEPINRTIVLVLQLSAIIPCGLIVLLYTVPLILGQTPLLGVVSTRLVLVTIFFGWAIGILRYRLFDFEYWWLKILLWLIGGSLVILIDFGILALFQISKDYALGISILIASFLYFPLRQWLLNFFFPNTHQTLQDFLPQFSLALANTTQLQDFEFQWEETLRRRFFPLHIQPYKEPLTQAKLVDNGMILLVPSLNQRSSYELIGKDKARHLFNTQDVRQIESLLSIAQTASNANELRQKAVSEERQRIMHDLHDTVGASLITLQHRLAQPESKEAVRQTLMLLRDTVKLSLKTSPIYIQNCLADWRAEILDRLEAAKIQLIWQVTGDLIPSTQPFIVNSKCILELTQILREILNNALKHANPSVIKINFHLVGRQLEVRIANNGDVSDPENWRIGTGLIGLQRRMAQINGHISFNKISESNQPWLITLLNCDLDQ